MSAAARTGPRPIHALPGRLRVRLTPVLPPRDGGIEAHLCRQPGVQRAALNILTGNVLILFDPSVTHAQAILNAIAAFDAAGAGVGTSAEPAAGPRMPAPFLAGSMSSSPPACGAVGGHSIAGGAVGGMGAAIDGEPPNPPVEASTPRIAGHSRVAALWSAIRMRMWRGLPRGVVSWGRRMARGVAPGAAPAADAGGPGDGVRPEAPGVWQEWAIEGLDCVECARTVERALADLPGVRSVALSVVTGRLLCRLDDAGPAPARVMQLVYALGYTLRSPAPGPRRVPWFRTRAGRRVAGSGALLALAGALSLLAPGLAVWGYVAATLLAVRPVARTAWAGARAGRPFTIETLVTIAALGALGIGSAAEGAAVVFLFAVGELLEGAAADRARRAVESLAEAAPTRALLLVERGTRDVPAASLAVGDRVRILPGGRVPADGVVIMGTADLDEAALTGESLPVRKAPGARVYAGSISIDGALTVEVCAPAAEGMLARLIGLVAEAAASTSPTARSIDRFASVYTPFVLAGGLLTAALPPLVVGAAWGVWAYRGLALLLLGCPCALVLSTPTALTSAMGAGVRHGLLIKSGRALDALAEVRVVAFDKTGTLTRGEPRVTDIVALENLDAAAVLSRAAAVEEASAHPLARAIVACANARGLAIPPAADGSALPGCAATAVVDGRWLAVGSPRYAREMGAWSGAEAAVARLEDEGKTAVVLLERACALGVLGLRDGPRPGADGGLTALEALDVARIMLTGDNPRAAGAIARGLNIDVAAGLLPSDKVSHIRHLKGQGTVAMVGDGLNDAPALAAADIGIVLGKGTDLALAAADAAVLHGAVVGVADLVRLARATRRTIRQNIAVALGLKALVAAMTLLGGTALWAAVLADTGATVLVTLNASRLLRFRGLSMGVGAGAPMIGSFSGSSGPSSSSSS